MVWICFPLTSLWFPLNSFLILSTAQINTFHPKSTTTRRLIKGEAGIGDGPSSWPELKPKMETLQWFPPSLSLIQFPIKTVYFSHMKDDSIKRSSAGPNTITDIQRLCCIPPYWNVNCRTFGGIGCDETIAGGPMRNKLHIFCSVVHSERMCGGKLPPIICTCRHLLTCLWPCPTEGNDRLIQGHLCIDRLLCRWWLQPKAAVFLFTSLRYTSNITPIYLPLLCLSPEDSMSSGGPLTRNWRKRKDKHQAYLLDEANSLNVSLKLQLWERGEIHRHTARSLRMMFLQTAFHTGLEKEGRWGAAICSSTARCH